MTSCAICAHKIWIKKNLYLSFRGLWISFNISERLFGHHYKVNSQQSEQYKELVRVICFLLVMCVAGGLLVESEEFSEFAQREVTFDVLLLIHHTAAQGFLMGLPLQDLLLNRPRLSAHKHTSQT